MKVLFVGATGMLGRPVARRLVTDGFHVRAMVREVDRARRLLPSDCELVTGDLRDAASLEPAMRGMDAVYINLAAPMKARPPNWEPELHGTQAIIEAAKRTSVKRVLRISAMGVDDAANQWWAADHKARADAGLMGSGLAWTILRPTWLMESLATMVLGRFLLTISLPGSLRWLAGDDLARQLAAALRSGAAIDKVYHPQGPELLTLRQASARFAATSGLRMLCLPMWPMRLGSMVNGRAAYLTALLKMTVNHFSRIDQRLLPTDLPSARMRIEDYVRYMRESGDRPRK